MQKKRVNWNTLFLTVGFSVLGFISRQVYYDVRETRDAVLVMKAQMVPRGEFDVQVSEIRTRLAAVELDIQKLKDHKQ